MRAARWHGRRDVRVERIPVPELRSGELLLRVRWCGICGTDVEEYRDGPVVVPAGTPNPISGQQAPIVLGHEFAGTVAAVAPDVTRFAVGDRLVPDVAMFCGSCHYCLRGEVALCESWATIGFHADGGLAEYVRVPERLCQPLPPSVSDEEAALIETTEVAVRAARHGNIGQGETVTVIGDGAVGLITAQVARALGASRVALVGHRPERLAIGRSLGVDLALDSRDPGWLDAVRHMTGGLGAHVAIECGGRASAIDDAVQSTRKGGRIVLLAVIGTPVPVDTWAIVAGERTLVGSVQHDVAVDLPIAIDLVASRRVDVRPLITRRIPLERIVEDGFEALIAGSGDIKVLVGADLDG
jgi:(R,R)-butanediol dehydrogenase/meso-butanediol dehydrogenase/diacetyl reductase